MSATFYISQPNSTSVQAYKAAQNGQFAFRFAPFAGDVVTVNMELTETKKPNQFYFSEEVPNAASKQQHVDLLQNTISNIKANNWGKVVVARAEVHQRKLNIWGLFEQLVRQYPKDCVYLFTCKVTGTWLGATPEMLLITEHNVLKTMSLAGTRRKGQESTFTAKEEEEQQLVTDYIKQILNDENGLSNLKVSATGKAEAGNLVHFKTSFTAEVSNSFEIESLLKKMHPTPAVAGFPKREAIDFILKNETFNRSFYSGYFGLQKGSESYHYVNLRCMQVFNNSYALYAGGGITKDSDPEAEYEETAAKMETLQRVITTL